VDHNAQTKSIRSTDPTKTTGRSILRLDRRRKCGSIVDNHNHIIREQATPETTKEESRDKHSHEKCHLESQTYSSSIHYYDRNSIFIIEHEPS
jgi:hypothetical protein